MKLLKKITNFIAHPRENYSNWPFLKYHILKSIYKIVRFNRKKTPSSDMFNWSLYNIYYRGEIKEAAKNYTLDLKENDYVFKNNKLIRVKENVHPLHPNHHLLYETILQLKPQSVFEIGCGNGMHLNNLQLLLPDTEFYGIDRSKEQVDFLRESSPFLKADVKVADATIRFPQEWFGKFDITFTQAVIMHIHNERSHLIALANLFNISRGYVILMERWKNHNFMNDIKKLQEEKLIKWGKIYFYYKILEETGKPHLMICSKTPLEYPELTDYNMLPNN